MDTKSKNKRIEVNRELKKTASPDLLKRVIAIKKQGYGSTKILCAYSGICPQAITAMLRTKKATKTTQEKLVKGIELWEADVETESIG